MSEARLEPQKYSVITNSMLRFFFKKKFVSAAVPLGYKLPVGQLFTEPSFFDDTDQILAELTCELDEQYLQLSSEVTPRTYLLFYGFMLINLKE